MKGLYLGIAGAALCAMGAGGAVAADWHDKANYPAKVTAVRFDTGFNITATTSVKYGSWDVAFGAASPVATFQEGYGNERVKVGGLRCVNSVAGSVPCSVVLGHSDKYDRNICNIFADDPANTSFSGLTIDCPTGLDFTP